jgi:hypothetical protein
MKQSRFKLGTAIAIQLSGYRTQQEVSQAVPIKTKDDSLISWN